MVVVVGLSLVSAAATLERGGQSQAPAASRIQGPVARAKVNINTAGAAEMERLPGITRELSQRIIAHRPYRKIDDLVRRKILGRKQLAGIKEYISVGGWGDTAGKAAAHAASGGSQGPR